MKVHCIADLHGFKPSLPGGDLLILAGDYTASDTLPQWHKFFVWLKDQDYEKKIMIAGNHDSLLESGLPDCDSPQESINEFIENLDVDVEVQYLCDEIATYKGLKIWGTPWTQWFNGVNPKCKAFMRSERYIEKKFRKIPEGVDILISHGPMQHMLDSNIKGQSCGSKSLRDIVDKVMPRFMIFGHIHEQGGQKMMYKHQGPNTWCVNCSYVDEKYKPLHGHCEIEI